MADKIQSPVYQTAWFVPEWGNTITKGKAFIITYTDWYDVTKAFFIPDGESVPKILNPKQVVFTKEHSISLLNREMLSLSDYYDRQIKEYAEKLLELQNKKS